jgi:hypothetical protein
MSGLDIVAATSCGLGGHIPMRYAPWSWQFCPRSACATTEGGDERVAAAALNATGGEPRFR